MSVEDVLDNSRYNQGCNGGFGFLDDANYDEGFVAEKDDHATFFEEEGEDQAYITAKDFMNDFATEEFLSKNIRVRPLSGVTRGDDDGKPGPVRDHRSYSHPGSRRLGARVLLAVQESSSGLRQKCLEDH